MISYLELFVLNRALDGNDIWGIPSFAEIDNSLDAINEAKQGLIDKGYLANAASFTDEGVRLTSRIERYKQADRYFKFQSIWAAVLDDGNAVTVAEQSRSVYEVNYLTAESIFEAISGRFGFLNGASQAPPREASAIEPSELFRMYYIDSESGFLVESASEGMKTASYLFFGLEGETLRYDNRTHVLRGMPPEAARQELRGMLSI
jgi:hypothetical protein